MTNAELIKGMTSIRYIIEGNKENYPEQTKNQLECIDEVIDILKEQNTQTPHTSL